MDPKQHDENLNEEKEKIDSSEDSLLDQREKIVLIYKKEGETPLECLDRLRKEQPLYKDAILSYAGRLDPMAEGLMLVLVDKENLFRRHYLGFDKTYEVDVLLGFSTDTGDALGKITAEDDQITGKVFSKEYLMQALKEFEGEIVLDYPAFSSKTVEGQTLFKLAREGKLQNINMPQKRSRIYKIEMLDQYNMNSEKLFDEIRNRIMKVGGDFRQEEILDIWLKKLRGLNRTFYLFRMRVDCTSGTYMRSLSESIALRLGTVGLAYKIKRTKVGSYEVVFS